MNELRNLLLDFAGAHWRAISIYLTKRQGRSYRQIHNEVKNPDLEKDNDLGRFYNGCANRFYGLLLLMIVMIILIECVNHGH